MRRARLVAWCVAAAASSIVYAAGPVTVGQHVEVREGDTWSPATVTAREGRRVRVHYDGRTGADPWVAADQVRAPDTTAAPAAKPAAAAKPAFGPKDHVEVKWGGLWRTATVVNVRGGWYLVDYTGLAGVEGREWAESDRLRKVGSTEDGIAYAKPHDYTRGDPPPKGPSLVGPDPYATPPATPVAGEPTPSTAVPTPPANPSADPSADLPEADFPTVAVDRGGAITLGDRPAEKAWAFQPAPDGPHPALSPKPMALRPAVGYADRLEGVRVSSSLTTPVLAVFWRGGSTSSLVCRVERFDLTTAKPLGVTVLPPGVVPLGVSPDGSAVVCRSERRGGNAWEANSRVDLFTIDAAAAARHVVSWLPASPTATGPDLPVDSAAFTDAGHVFVRHGNAAASLFALDGARSPHLVYTTRADLRDPAKLLAGGRLVATSADSRVTFFDAVTGRTVGSVASNGNSFTAAQTFADDRGARLALTTDDGLTAVDGATGAITSQFAAPDVGPFKGVDVLPGGLMLAGHHSLIDPARGLTFWQYVLPYHLDEARQAVAFGGRLYYAEIPSGQGAVGYVASAPLAEPAVVASEKQVADADLYLLRPGGSVGVDVTDVDGTDADRRAAADAIGHTLTKVGLTVAEGAAVTAKASIQPAGETEEAYGGMLGTPRRAVTVKQCRLTLSYVANGKTVWTREVMSTGMPGILPQGVTPAAAAATANPHDPKQFALFDPPGSVPIGGTHIQGITGLGPTGPTASHPPRRHR